MRRGDNLLDAGLLGDVITVRSSGTGEGHSPGRRVGGGKLRYFYEYMLMFKTAIINTTILRRAQKGNSVTTRSKLMSNIAIQQNPVLPRSRTQEEFL